MALEVFFWGLEEMIWFHWPKKLSKAITTSNQRKGGYIKSQEERTVKTIKLSEGQENASDQFIKADFISTLPRLNFLACLSPSCSRQSPKKKPVPESKLVSPSFKTRESYLGFLSLVYAATFAGSAFMPVLSARSDFVHRYCLTWQVKRTALLLSLTASTTCSAFVLFFTTRF